MSDSGPRPITPSQEIPRAHPPRVPPPFHHAQGGDAAVRPANLDVLQARLRADRAPRRGSVRILVAASRDTRRSTFRDPRGPPPGPGRNQHQVRDQGHRRSRRLSRRVRTAAARPPERASDPRLPSVALQAPVPTPQPTHGHQPPAECRRVLSPEAEAPEVSANLPELSCPQAASISGPSRRTVQRSPPCWTRSGPHRIFELRRKDGWSTGFQGSG